MTEFDRVLERIDCNRLIEQVVSLTRGRWSDQPQQRGVVIQMRTELDENLPEVMGSEVAIRDALTSLISDAVDAMTEGGTLTLRTRQSGGRLRDSNETHRVFIEVTDTTGTTARLIFTAEEPLLQNCAAGTAAPALTGRLRILLVDDDPMLLKALGGVLKEDGHEVSVAHGGQQGIDTFMSGLSRRAPFSIVITDFGMPYVDGRRVAAAVKAAAAETPVILLTGWGKRLLAERNIPPHVDRILSKPPQMVEVRAVLAELTRDQTPIPAAAAAAENSA